jgi:hypothetical protein
MKKTTIKILLAALLMITGTNALAATANQERINETLEILRLAINAHDYSMLKPSLDDDFSFQGRDFFMSDMIMRQVVNDYPQEISEIQVISITALEEGWEVAILLEGKKPSKQRKVSFNENYLIKQADIADIQIQGH